MTLNQKHAVGEFLHRSFFHSSYDKIRFWDLKQSYANLAKVASVTWWEYLLRFTLDPFKKLSMRPEVEIFYLS